MPKGATRMIDTEAQSLVPAALSRSSSGDTTPQLSTRPSICTRAGDRVKTVLTQNVTAEKLCLSLALGFCIGVFPVVGVTFLMSAAAGYLLDLNIPAMQLINAIATPFELLLFVPFLRVGEVALFTKTPLDVSVTDIFALLKSDVKAALAKFGTALMIASLGWLFLLVPLCASLYMCMLPLVRLAAQSMGKKEY